MGYITLGKFYNQGTVISVKLDKPVKRAQSDAMYNAYVVNYEDKTTGEIESVRWATSFFALSYQDVIRGKVESLKAGDEVTFYKEKSGKTAEYEALEDGSDEKKKFGFWGCKTIYDGFVIPPEMEGQESSGKAPAPYKQKDNTAIILGNALTVANAMKPKTTKFEAVVDFAVDEVMPAQTELKAVLVEEFPDMDDYSIGARLGQCLHITAGRVKDIEKLKEGAMILFGLMCSAEAKVRAIPKEKAKEVGDAHPDDGLVAGEDFEDDIPF